MKRDLVLEQLVIEEATNLKKYATKKELSKLNYNTLGGDRIDKCVYGQMTDNCFSRRSYNLIRNCTSRVFNVKDTDDIFNGKLNGKPSKLDEPERRYKYYISPIEQFLYNYKPDSFKKSIKIKKLVDFLQDKTQELKF